MQYVCQICGYIYDEAVEKVPFTSLPDDWVCPNCGAPKSMFSLVEEVKPTTLAKESEIEADVAEIHPLALAAICSNLARGQEKQYQEEGQKLFLELANYFTTLTNLPKESSLATLAKLVNDDLDNKYLNLTAKAKEVSDRGAQRICVWGQKATNMTKALLERYQKEGPNFLDGQKIFVCSVCGFIYIGQKAPSICPVCKVPDWKFTEMEDLR